MAGSQGVGDVEKVDSLDDIVSLPALRLSGMEESVVEAPLKLLSAPAKEAAEELRKAEEGRVSAENLRTDDEKKNVPLLKAPVPPLKLRVSIRRRPCDG